MKNGNSKYNLKEMLVIKNTIIKIKNVFTESSIDWRHRSGKESLSSKKCQQKHPKVKCKEKKRMKENRILKKCAINNYKECNIWVTRIAQGGEKEKKGREEILETMTDNVPKSMINIKPQIKEAHPLLKRKSPENLYQIISYSNFRKSKTSEKSLK